VAKLVAVIAVWTLAVANANAADPRVRADHSIAATAGPAGEVAVSENGVGAFLVPSADFRGDVNWEVRLVLDSRDVGSDGLFRVKSEDAIEVGPRHGALLYRTRLPQYEGDRMGPIPAAFSKGVAPFYVMNYGITQGQYAGGGPRAITYDCRGVRTASAPQPDLSRELRRIAAAAPGTLGVRVVHVETGVGYGINDDDQFPMMSVYKLPIAIHALRQAQSRLLDLSAKVTLRANDRRPGFSPIARTIEKDGPQTVSVRDLISAIIRVSDNTASDWVLRKVGGPSAVAATLQEFGLKEIDISRYELEFAADYRGVKIPSPYSLERFVEAVERVPEHARRRAASAYVSDPRDAASPRGFADLLKRLARGELLNRQNTDWILSEMSETHARDSRLRAGLPSGTLAALRPGTSGETAGVRAAHNDTGVITLPDGSHLVMVAFLKRAKGSEAERDAVLARVARIAHEWAISR
jgi:beta-lactamase class A